MPGTSANKVRGITTCYVIPLYPGTVKTHTRTSYELMLRSRSLSTEVVREGCDGEGEEKKRRRESKTDDNERRRNGRVMRQGKKRQVRRVKE
jgi:hypothetical protein